MEENESGCPVVKSNIGWEKVKVGKTHHQHLRLDGSPYTQHNNMQLSTNNFINILYFRIHFKLLFKA
jgi:hypothetical protein